MENNIDPIDEFIKRNSPRFKKWKQHLQDFDWSKDVHLLFIEEKDIVMFGKTANYEQEFYQKDNEFRVQVGLVKKILDRLKFFIDKSKGDYKNPKFKTFFKLATNIINIHLKRCDKYSLEIDETDINIHDLRSKEAKFNSEVFAEYSKVDQTLTSYGFVEEEDKGSDNIEFFDNKKASLSVYKEIVRDFPAVREKMKTLKIDEYFKLPPPKTLHILNENPPIWNSEKHFWEQDKATLEYYVDELKKIDNGVDVDGVFFDGWIYYHINHFRTPVPFLKIINGVEETEDRVVVPPLRDNEWLVTNYFNKAKRDKKYALIAATRRAAKTTMNASRVERAKLLGRAQILVAGGSAKDLGQIERNCNINMDNCEPAFSIWALGEGDKGGTDFGIRTKDNRRKRHSSVIFINLDGGTNKKKAESLAGFTPDEFILDEAFKFHFKEQLSALHPALTAKGILRCIPLITATGGDDDLAADGIKMLSNPEDNKVTLMDWSELERNVPESMITWTPRPFGLFLPGQMSTNFGDKVDIDFTVYLGLDRKKHPTLSKLKIGVTDWDSTLKRINVERDLLISDKKEYVKLLAYHPIDPSEIFLSGKENPFPVAEAKAHRKYLWESGLWDRRREMFKDAQGNIQVELSQRPVIEYPYKGVMDAPFMIFENPPKERVPLGTYTGGFDDYKQEDSETDSVATFYVWKNEILGDPFSKKIVASLSIRPEKHKTVWEKWLLLMEAYQLETTAFGENEDYKIKDFLDIRHLSEKYLADSLDFTSFFQVSNNQKRKSGWTPRASKRFLFELFAEYCNETYDIEVEDPLDKSITKIIEVKGVQLIDDIYLLDEIISYQENANVDRIIAAMGGYGYIHYLISAHRWVPSKSFGRFQTQKDEARKEIQRTKSFYQKNLRPTYRSRR